MITVEAVRTAAAKRLRSRMGEWAGRLVVGEDIDEGYSLGLKPPTEAQALGDRDAAQEWVRRWREADGVRGCEVDWEERAWSRLARQTVPVRVRFADPRSLAEFAGGDERAAWRRIATRARTVRERFAGGDGGLGGGSGGERGDAHGERAPSVERLRDLAAVVRGSRATLVSLDDAEFERVLDAAEWLVEHPQERLRPRQMPLRGVDSKWFTKHRKLVSALFRALTGGRELEILDPEDTVRIRVLGPSAVDGEREPSAERGATEGLGPVGRSDAGVLAGLTDLAAPAEQVAALPLRPRLVIVSENLESMLALPEWDGVVAVHGSGYAVSVVGELRWLRDVPILYWGDLDSHGFAILHRLRSHLGREGRVLSAGAVLEGALSGPREGEGPRMAQVTSVLMDEDTLMDHEDLWVREEKPHRGSFGELTGREQRALARVRSEGDVRLEQERIPWDAALAALRAAAGLLRPSTGP